MEHSNNETLLLRKAMLEQHEGRLDNAETLYLTLLTEKVNEEYVLNQLVEISLQKKQLGNTVELMRRLVKLVPTQYRYCQDLATLYQEMNQWQMACQLYKDFIQTNQGKVDADCRYNYGYSLKQAGLYQESIQNYQIALDLNISEPEEVLLNMSVIYSENLRAEHEAISVLELACQKNSKYTPALFNLAQLYEEEGNKEKAAQLYREVLALEPENFQTMARLLELSNAGDVDPSLVTKVEKVLNTETLATSTKIDLHYALGKVMDSCREYDRAFDSYSDANKLEDKFDAPYSKSEQVQVVEQNIQVFTDEWFDRLPTISEAAPIFVCGMFRSGSTLVEQILASHDAVTAGGEREFFIRMVMGKLSPYPEQVLGLDAEQMRSIAQGYLKDLTTAFPDSEYITDKRPENFLYIGLIKSLFPNAKIIYTTRNPYDNCLSIYFVRLAKRMSYATKLENIAHYYKQHQRLMDYWQSKFARDIYQVDYDSLVIDPKSSLEGLFNFLDLKWNNDQLNFHQLDNRVKTASLWQVRQPLYQSSSGRWKNYEAHIDILKREFASS